MRRKMTKWSAPLIMICLAFASGCGHKGEADEEVAAQQLYSRSAALMHLYIDSMAAAADSAEVVRLERAYDSALTRLNYDFPPEADAAIPQAENDTLISLTQRYIGIRDSLLWRFAHPIVPHDTIPTDEEKESETT